MNRQDAFLIIALLAVDVNSIPQSLVDKKGVINCARPSLDVVEPYGRIAWGSTAPILLTFVPQTIGGGQFLDGGALVRVEVDSKVVDDSPWSRVCRGRRVVYPDQTEFAVKTAFKRKDRSRLAKTKLCT